MKKMVFTLISALLFSMSSLAFEVVLTTTDNDDNNEVYKLVIEVDESTQTLKQLYKDTYVNGAKIRRDILDAKDLKTRDGMILEKRDRYNVLNLKSDNFDHDRGGRIIIDTLYHAIKGERKTYEVELAKDQASWKLFKNQKSVSKFHVKVNRVVIGGTVGIKNIVME